MKEVILNDECAHCNDKECHDGEHFCNQAMKDNSFYKNAKLYKGLEIIKRPTYEELEKEKDVIRRKADEAIADKLLITAKYNEILNDINQEKDNLQKENAKLKEKLEAMTKDRDRWLNVDKEDCGHLREAKEIIKSLIQLVDFLNEDNEREPLVCKAEDFIK